MSAPTPDLLDAWRSLWVNRSRPYALQRGDGTYCWVHRTLPDELLRAHLDGEATFALSSTDARGWTRWVCLDADAPDALPQLLALCSTLAAHDLPGLAEASRRGGHLWILLEESVPAVEARWVVVEALAAIRAKGEIAVPSCELYPTASVPGTLGHPVRLPLGIHRLTGRRYALFDANGYPCAFTSTEAALRFVLDAPRVPTSIIRRAWARFQGSGVPTANSNGARNDLQMMEPPLVPADHVGTTSVVIRWVDANVSPLDLLAESVPESATRKVGQGWLCWCPFHDDRAPDTLGHLDTPSLYIVRNRRYGWSWRCLSSNCAHSVGPMRHSFRLYQELLRLDAATAIQSAVERWPELKQEGTDDHGETATY